MEMMFWKGLLTVLEWWDFIIEHAAGKFNERNCEDLANAKEYISPFFDLMLQQLYVEDDCLIIIL